MRPCQPYGTPTISMARSRLCTETDSPLPACHFVRVVFGRGHDTRGEGQVRASAGQLVSDHVSLNVQRADSKCVW